MPSIRMLEREVQKLMLFSRGDTMDTRTDKIFDFSLVSCESGSFFGEEFTYTV